jgi:hypothetical protein
MVSLQAAGLEPVLVGRLERAIQKAVNDAVSEVGKRKGEQVMAAVKRNVQK